MKRLVGLLATLVAFVLVSVGAPNAHADPAFGAIDAHSAWHALEVAVPDLKSDLIAGHENETDAPDLVLTGPSIVIDRAPSGVALREHHEGFLSTRVVRDSGKSVQHLLVLPDRDSPAEFSFDVGRATLATDDDGIISLTLDGSRWFVAPAWATDARGAAVPTHFEVRGGSLVQVVSHREAAFEYPIVADPFLGLNIFQSLYSTSASGDIRYNGSLTSWGKTILNAAVLGGAVGGVSAQIILRTNGWNEWKAKWPAITNKATLKQQFDCHTLGWVLVVNQEWNLERFRSNNANWLSGVNNHKCNW